MLSKDLLRTGAALVRRLAEGDADVRLVLSDFLEEHGMPNRAGRFAGRDVLARTLAELRSDAKDRQRGSIHRGVHQYVIGTSFVYCTYVGPEQTVWIGTWPLWAWDGE